MTTEAPDFTLEQRDDCLVFTLTRPAKRNSITLAMLEGLEDCCAQLDAGGARALVITGEGDRAFCAGTDLSESATLGMEASAAKTVRARELFLRIYRSPWTSVAALNGLAYGGGLELALACTFRVALPTARLALPEVKLGVLPAYGGTQYLPAVVGRSRALDLMLTGRSVEGDEALAFGLVDRLATDASSLLDDTFAFAALVLAHSQFAIDRIRRCVESAGGGVTEQGLEVEAQAFEECMKSEDAVEGVTAFMEKRPPNFKHR